MAVQIDSDTEQWFSLSLHMAALFACEGYLPCSSGIIYMKMVVQSTPTLIEFHISCMYDGVAAYKYIYFADTECESDTDYMSKFNAQNIFFIGIQYSLLLCCFSPLFEEEATSTDLQLCSKCCNTAKLKLVWETK